LRREKGERVTEPSRVLVIGGLGFIGVNLTERLLADGRIVTVVTPSRERHAASADRFEVRGVRIVEGDLRDSRTMIDAVAGQQVVFNLAGESGAVRSMEDPWKDLDVNCRGNLVLLEALRAANRDAKLVFVGSRLQYGRQGAQPVDEDRRPDPLCLHAIHKLTVEKYLRLYRRLFGLRYTVARVTNPYGPGQPEGRTAFGVVNRLIQLALAGETLPIYGDGTQRRDYIHVDDVVSALIRLSESPSSDGVAFNVGSGVGTRMIDMVAAIIDMAGGGCVEHIPWPELAGLIETGDFVADVSRLRARLDWAPTLSLTDGLRKTIAFYQSHVAS
jgi:nucleoside-diphosphate-sugar epimerase